MEKNKKKLLIMLVFIFCAILILTLIVPMCFTVPESSVTEKQLADKDSRFVSINGLDVHYKKYGDGEPVYILLHGTLTTTFTWNEIVSPLAQKGTVIAYDRPSFGLTSRPMAGEWKTESPYSYDAQVKLLIQLMDALSVKKAILIGNSMGGAIAWMTAERYPQRVQALILADAVQNRHGLPPVAAVLARTAQLRHLGPLLLNSKIKNFGYYLYPLSWHDPSKIRQEYYDEYFKIFNVKNFDKGLWEFLIAARPLESLLNAEKISVPTLVITGDDDRVAGVEKIDNGTEDLMQLASRIKNAKLSVIKNCGHVPQEECPAEFVQAVDDFLIELK